MPLCKPRPTPATEAPGIIKPMQGAAEATTSMDPRLAAAKCSITFRLRALYVSELNTSRELNQECSRERATRLAALPADELARKMCLQLDAIFGSAQNPTPCSKA